MRQIARQNPEFCFSYCETESGSQKLSGQFKMFGVGRLAGYFEKKGEQPTPYAVPPCAVAWIYKSSLTILFGGRERSRSLFQSGSGNGTPETKLFRASRSDRFFQRIYQQAATGIAITDWLGIFQECNPAYCALLGYTEEELCTVDFA